jgi:hypothetical protein
MKELFESDLLYTDEPRCPPYLFSSAHGRVEFVIIEEEMSQLNDFCVLLLDSPRERLSYEAQSLERFTSGKEQVIDPELGDVTEDVIMGLEDIVIPTWRDTVDFVSRATTLILLHVFTEKSLKHLCLSFTPDNPAKPPRQSARQSKIDTYLNFLSQNCGFIFEEPSTGRELRTAIARIRNAFAHGDWEAVRRDIRQLSITDAFRTATELFQKLESAAESLR